MTTIRDVARRAKVSVTTASYALNGVGSISDATRQRVLKAAEELNYHPNAFARHLKKVKTQTIGVFITGFGGAFWDEILEGIHEVMLTTEYDLVVCPRSRSERRILMYRQVDGAIVFDSDISDEIVLKLASRRFPIVVMDRLLQADFVAPVLLDNAQGVREAFQHFYDQGLHKMAFVSGDLNSFDNTERMQTFLDEARKFHLQPTLHYGAFTEISGYTVARRIIQSGDLPQAVFCANDQMAIGFLRAMQEHGLNAPEDIAVVGFDDILLSRCVQPTLSTVGASRQAWGASAIRQLIGFLEHETPLCLQRIPTRLVPRQSSTLKRKA
ncbi:LacI family DNA-binding transcriptional regulator [Caldilinea sp.]|jgi:LacI family transcriptional regulator|uniref:LacI family DNA-binding transcriptional regulator n=1 Tax=Caldilinea sp. TaxID=2293560 RepID=UPI001B0AA1CE|nr:LacI family DNA-binding transcriptional regulator [Caldilinea sp.]MBO9391796.1 LacI family DNA-binding transcriptional regulator [Caldilinea sp.]